MLKKNKDYVEFTLQYTSVDWARSKDCPEVCLNGYSDFSFPGVPIMDVVCNEFDHKVVVVSKMDFEKLQTENKELKQKLHGFDPTPEFKELLKNLYSIEDVEKLEWFLNHVCGGLGSATGWRSIATFWKNRYNDLFKLIGFSSVEEIQDYLTNEAECDTLQEAISKLKDQVKYTCDKWYSANRRNNSWKAAAECNSPHELIEKLNLLRDDISGHDTVIESYERNIKKWQKATGYLRPEDISTASLVTKAMQLDQEVKILNGALQEWKEVTGCPTPEAAKALIESGISYEYAYHEAQKENRKLTEEVDSWKNVTGYSTPEDYMHARISGAFHTPFDYTAAWQKATGCDTPEAAKYRINNLIGEAEAWESDYNHLLALTGFDNEGEIEDFLEQNNDRNKLTTVVDNLKLENEAMKTALRASNLAMQKELESNIDEWQKFTGCDTPEEAGCKINDLCDEICKRKGDYDHLLELTGYKTEQDIRVLLNDSEQFVYKDIRELINSLKRKAKFTESNWQKVTGFSIPEKCSSYIDRLEKKLEDIKNLTEED